MLPPPPELGQVDVDSLKAKHVEHRLSRAPVPRPVNEQTVARDLDLAERSAHGQARDDQERYFRRIVQRDVGLVAEGWTFDQIDAANCQRKPMSARQMRKAAEAVTAKPVKR